MRKVNVAFDLGEPKPLFGPANGKPKPLFGLAIGKPKSRFGPAIKSSFSPLWNGNKLSTLKFTIVDGSGNIAVSYTHLTLPTIA